MKSLSSIKEKAKKVLNPYLLLGVVCGTLIWMASELLVGPMLSVQPLSQSQEQKYIVRNCIFVWTEQTDYAQLIDEHGNIWEIVDPPEYANGTVLRVLFDSQQTAEVTDDAVIDLSEVK